MLRIRPPKQKAVLKASSWLRSSSRMTLLIRSMACFLDIHSNRGTRGPGEYKVNNFIFAPGFDEKSEKIMNELLLKIPEIEYYVPEYRTSPAYITEPTAEAGIPTIVYETYSYEPIEISYDLACKLISSVDSLEF